MTRRTEPRLFTHIFTPSCEEPPFTTISFNRSGGPDCSPPRNRLDSPLDEREGGHASTQIVWSPQRDHADNARSLDQATYPHCRPAFRWQHGFVTSLRYPLCTQTIKSITDSIPGHNKTRQPVTDLNPGRSFQPRFPGNNHRGHT